MKIFLLITVVLYSIVFCSADAKSIPKNSKMLFWQTGIRKGANVFNRKIDSELIEAAKEYKIGFIRLASDKFETTQRDFLLGDADNYQGLVSKDLEALKNILDAFSSTKNTGSLNYA